MSEIMKKFSTMPDGWAFDKTWGSPLAGYVPISNGKSLLNGGLKGLLKIDISNYKSRVSTIDKIKIRSQKKQTRQAEKNTTDDDRKIQSILMNDLSRAKFKEKLMKDLMFDLMVCKIEKWDIESYILDLKNLIDDIAFSVSGKKD